MATRSLTQADGPPAICRLFANAKFSKDHVENLLDIDPTRQLAEAGHRLAEMLGDQFFTGTLLGPLRCASQCRGDFAQPSALALARDQRRFQGEALLGKFNKGRQKPIESGA